MQLLFYTFVMIFVTALTLVLGIFSIPCEFVDTTMIQYGRQDLLALQYHNDFNLENNTRTALQNLNLHEIVMQKPRKNRRKTHRGMAAGRKRIYNIKTIVDMFDVNRNGEDQNVIQRQSILTPVKFVSDYGLGGYLKLSLWNSRSMMNKSAAICDSILNNNTDIFIITESWIESSKRTFIDADLNSTLIGFVTVHCPRAKNRKGGGLSVIVKSELKISDNRAPVFKTFEILDLNIYNRGKNDFFTL